MTKHPAPRDPIAARVAALNRQADRMPEPIRAVLVGPAPQSPARPVTLTSRRQVLAQTFASEAAVADLAAGAPIGEREQARMRGRSIAARFIRSELLTRRNRPQLRRLADALERYQIMVALSVNPEAAGREQMYAHGATLIRAVLLGEE